MIPGGGGCSELRLCHCTPAWVTEQNSVKKKRGEQIQRKEEKEERKRRRVGEGKKVALCEARMVIYLELRGLGKTDKDRDTETETEIDRQTERQRRGAREQPEN